MMQRVHTIFCALLLVLSTATATTGCAPEPEEQDTLGGDSQGAVDAQQLERYRAALPSASNLVARTPEATQQGASQKVSTGGARQLTPLDGVAGDALFPAHAREGVRAAQRMDPGSEQAFVGVDIAQTSDEALVHQQGFNLSAVSLQHFV